MIEKDEKWSVIHVDPNNIICKTCKHKNGGMKYPHYTKGCCEKYPSPLFTKPHDVLFEGADCEYYEPEEE
jgi:hypothetical protein